MKRLILISLLLPVFILFGASFSFAEEAAQGLASSVKIYIALASGFGIAIAAFGGALGQSRAISSGLEGIARNPSAQPKIFIPMIVGLALIESLVIYALVISFILVGKI
jgi:F-type H+-transporting ATPase subunit c